MAEWIEIPAHRVLAVPYREACEAYDAVYADGCREPLGTRIRPNERVMMLERHIDRKLFLVSPWWRHDWAMTDTIYLVEQ